MIDDDTNRDAPASSLQRMVRRLDNAELAAVDADIREYFMADEAARYVPKLPIMIQLVRLLRRLLDERDDGQNGASHSKGTENDVEPQKLHGQAGGRPLVSVDGLSEALDENSAERTLNLLVELGTRLRMVAESLDHLGHRHIDVAAVFGVGFGHGVVKSPNDPSSATAPAAVVERKEDVR